MKRYIVWNAAKSEGFVTDDYSDAVSIFNGNFESGHSALGYDFYKYYGDEEMHLEVIDLSAARLAMEAGK